MAQTILLKRRTADSTAPVANDLTTGEIAVNAYSGKLYVKKTDGTVAEISGSGGSSGLIPSATFVKYEYTATSGQTTFSGNDDNSQSLTYVVGNILVYKQGELLDTSDYTASNGSSIVLGSGATANDIVSIISYNKNIGTGNTTIVTFSGNGSTTAFTLSEDPGDENNTRVFIDGIYQSKSNYSVSGTTLTFSTAPPSGTGIEVEIGNREISTSGITEMTITGDLTVDTNTLFVDSSDNRVGIGTTSPSTTLQVAGTATATAFAGPLTGNVTGNVSGSAGSTTGNAATATALATARTISGTSFDGTANITLNTSGITENTNLYYTDARVASYLSTNSYATQSWTTTQINNLIDSAPGALNTLNELAAALGDDASFSTTMTNSLALKVGITASTGAAGMPVGTTGQRPGSPAAGQFRYNSTLSKFEGYTDSWGEIGGGGGSNTFTTDNFTGNNSTTAFTLSQTVESEDNLIVFEEGIYQNKGDYTLSGTTLTFDEAPASGRKITVFSVKSAISGSNLNQNSFTGNGSTAAYTLSLAPVNENNTQVFLDGVYQHKNTYSVSGTTLTFDTNIPNGTAIEVMTFNQTDINVPTDDSITTAKIVDDAVTSAKLASGLTLGGNTAATLSTAAQPNITSVGTLTALQVDNINVNANTISSTDTNGNITIAPNGTGDIYANTDKMIVLAAEGESATLMIVSDESDDNGDDWSFVANQSNNTLTIENDISGSSVAHMTLTPHATVASSTVSIPGVLSSGEHIVAGASYATLRLEENDATDLNTSMFNSGGDFVITTSSDNRSTTTDRLRLDHATGNIGIGTSVDAKLHVDEAGEPGANGTLILEANSSSRQIRIAPPSNAANGYIDYRGGNLLFKDDGTEVARFQGSTSFDVNSGNIRVGAAGGNATAIVQGSSGAGNTNQPGSDLQLKGGSGGGTGGSKVRIFTAPGGSSGTSESAAVERMIITEEGTVGIGTDPGLTRLNVVYDAANWTGIFKNTHSNAYGLSIDLGNSSGAGGQANIFALATYTPVGTGFFVLKGGNVGIGRTDPYDTFVVSRASTDQLEGVVLENTQAGGYGTGITWESQRSDVSSTQTAGRIYVAGEQNWGSDTYASSAMYFQLRSQNSVGTRLAISAAGTFTGSASNDISDERLKENIQTITDPLTKVKSLTGRTFNWKEESGQAPGVKYGFIAQEVEAVISDLVHDKSGIIKIKPDNSINQAPMPEDEGEYAKSVQATGIIPILVEAIKELSAKVEALENK